MFIAKSEYKRSENSKLYLEYLKRKLLKIKENKKLIMKFVSKQKIIKLKAQAMFFIKYNSIYTKKGGCTLVKNMCHITGRGRSVSRFVKLSRHSFKEFASFAKMSGVSKSGW